LEGSFSESDNYVVPGRPTRFIAPQTSVNRIMTEQVVQGIGISQVVDRDEIQIRVVHCAANSQPSNTAKPVDRHFDGHCYPPLWECWVSRGGATGADQKQELSADQKQELNRELNMEKPDYKGGLDQVKPFFGQRVNLDTSPIIYSMIESKLLSVNSH
jgi:hypothetical protein